MCGRIVVAFLTVIFFLPLGLPAQKGSSSSHSSKSTSSKSKSKPSKSSSPSSDKPVHVKTYERKDGTTVSAHDRSVPGTKTKTTAKVKRTKSSTSSSSAITEKST